MEDQKVYSLSCKYFLIQDQLWTKENIKLHYNSHFVSNCEPDTLRLLRSPVVLWNGGWGWGRGRVSEVGKYILLSISSKWDKEKSMQQDLAFKAGAQNNSQRSFCCTGLWRNVLVILVLSTSRVLVVRF